MAARRPKTIRPVSTTLIPFVDDPKISRAFDVVSNAVQDLQAQRQRDLVTADLVVGTNRVRHGLARAVVGYTITPSVATIAFAHALAAGNPHPELEVWIDVVGSDMPATKIEVY